jgi:hypothetical protein
LIYGIGGGILHKLAVMGVGTKATNCMEGWVLERET